MIAKQTEVIKLWNSKTRGLRDQVRATRAKVKYKCVVNSLGNDTVQHVFQTKDISETGFYILGNRPKYEFNSSTLLEVQLHAPDGEQINLMMKIVRSLNRNQFGLKVVQAERSESEKLHKLICGLILDQAG